MATTKMTIEECDQKIKNNDLSCIRMIRRVSKDKDGHLSTYEDKNGNTQPNTVIWAEFEFFDSTIYRTSIRHAIESLYDRGITAGKINVPKEYSKAEIAINGVRTVSVEYANGNSYDVPEFY